MDHKLWLITSDEKILMKKFIRILQPLQTLFAKPFAAVRYLLLSQMHLSCQTVVCKLPACKQ